MYIIQCPQIRNHEYRVSDLLKKCADRGLSTKCRKATLVSRSQQYASSRPPTSSQPSDTATPNILTSETSTPVLTVEGAHTPSLLLNDAQMTQVRSILSRGIEDSINNGNCKPSGPCCCECIAMFSNLAKRKFASDSRGPSSRSTPTSSTRSPDPVPVTVPTVVIPDFPPHVPENESFVSTQMLYFGHFPHWMCPLPMSSRYKRVSFFIYQKYYLVNSLPLRMRTLWS